MLDVIESWLYEWCNRQSTLTEFRRRDLDKAVRRHSWTPTAPRLESVAFRSMRYGVLSDA